MATTQQTILQLPEVLSRIFSFSLRPAVLFRYNLVCKAWNQVVEEDEFFIEHSKEWKQLQTRIDKAFMWTEYYSLCNMSVYEHYLDFKNRIRIVSSQDDPNVELELYSRDGDEIFRFLMKSLKNEFLIETRGDSQQNIVSESNVEASTMLKIQAILSSYYYAMIESDIEEVNVNNLKSLMSFKETHFPNVPVDGFYSILESFVYGQYDDAYPYLIERGIERSSRLVDENKLQVMKLYNNYQFNDTLLGRTLSCKNFELTENLMRKGHILAEPQVDSLTKYIKLSDPFTALFICKYLKHHNIDPRKYNSDLESMLDSPPDVCKIFIEEQIVECPDILIDTVSSHVNFQAIDYLKQVNPNLLCPLDTRSIKKMKLPKIRLLYENAT